MVNRTEHRRCCAILPTAARWSRWHDCVEEVSAIACDHTSSIARENVQHQRFTFSRSSVSLFHQAQLGNADVGPKKQFHPKSRSVCFSKRVDLMTSKGVEFVPSILYDFALFTPRALCVRRIDLMTSKEIKLCVL